MFRISLDALLILDAIDRRGSFSAAGAELHRVPSTISYTVSKLEQDLGVQVFERQGPKVLLTKAGTELLKEGRYLLRAAFYQVADKTRLRILHESLDGNWEALLDRRVDLLIAVPGTGPAGGGYIAEPIGTVQFVFVVAPNHPLATMDKVLSKADLHPYRAITVADSAIRLSSRTVGLLFGQDTLTVPDMRSKYALQLAGIGFGFLPEPLARSALASGALVQKEVEEQRLDESFSLAWRVGEEGAALKWWLQRLRESDVLQRLLAEMVCGSA